jgi:hypothetical protein
MTGIDGKATLALAVKAISGRPSSYMATVLTNGDILAIAAYVEGLEAELIDRKWRRRHDHYED